MRPKPTQFKVLSLVFPLACLVAILMGPAGEAARISRVNKVVERITLVSGQSQPGVNYATPKSAQVYTSLETEPEGPSKPGRYQLPEAPFLNVMPPSRPPTTVTVRSPTQPPAPNDPLTVLQNWTVTTGPNSNQVNPTSEPSLAQKDSTIFYTGNTFAAVSTNGGINFTYVSPFQFPAVDGGACCDQVVEYIPRIDRFLWLIQYWRGTNGSNRYRIAVASPAELAQPAPNWTTFDIQSEDLRVPGQLIDFPNLVVGENVVYLVCNSFGSSGFTKSHFVRIPFGEFLKSQGSALNFVRADISRFNPRIAENAGTTAYFAAHVDTGNYRLYTLNEGSTTINAVDIDGPDWTRNFESFGSDGQNWMRGADGRMLAAARRNNELWFGWTAGRDASKGRPQPYIQIVKVDVNSLTQVGTDEIWSPTVIFGYPSLCANSEGEVGLSSFWANVNGVPDHQVGFLTGTRRFVATDNGGNGPTGPSNHGDYLTIRRHQPNGKFFVASGFVLKGGGGFGAAVPRYIAFGRSGDVGLFNATGVVRDGSGAPVEGVKVTLDADPNRSTTTDAQGRYGITGLAAGFHQLFVVKSGFDIGPFQPSITAGPADPVQDFVATAQRVSVVGTIKLANGDAVEGVDIAVSGPEEATARTDRFGLYSTRALLPGEYTVTPSKSGFRFRPATATITLPDRSGADFEAEHGAGRVFLIGGTIKDRTGIPIAGVKFKTRGQELSTDENGAYLFALKPGDYQIRPEKDGYEFSPAQRRINVNRNNGSVNFEGNEYARVESLVLSAITVRGGTSVRGNRVTLSKAERYKQLVGISSSKDSLAEVPSSVGIAANATTGDFTIKTKKVRRVTKITIRAQYHSQTNAKSAELTITP